MVGRVVGAGGEGARGQGAEIVAKLYAFLVEKENDAVRAIRGS